MVCKQCKCWIYHNVRHNRGTHRMTWRENAMHVSMMLGTWGEGMSMRGISIYVNGEIPMESGQVRTAIERVHCYWNFTIPIHKEDSQNNKSERHVLPFGIRPMCVVWRILWCMITRRCLVVTLSCAYNVSGSANSGHLTKAMAKILGVKYL